MDGQHERVAARLDVMRAIRAGRVVSSRVREWIPRAVHADVYCLYVCGGAVGVGHARSRSECQDSLNQPSARVCVCVVSSPARASLIHEPASRPDGTRAIRTYS